MYIKTPVSPIALLPFLTRHLVSALGPALVSFVLLVPLVGLCVPRMKVLAPAYDLPIVLLG